MVAPKRTDVDALEHAESNLGAHGAVALDRMHSISPSPGDVEDRERWALAGSSTRLGATSASFCSVMPVRAPGDGTARRTRARPRRSSGRGRRASERTRCSPRCRRGPNRRPPLVVVTRLDRPRYRTPQGRLDVVERDACLLLTPFKTKGMGPSWSTAQDARSNRRRVHCAPPRAGNMAGPLMQMPNGQMIVRSPARRPSARSAFRGARDRPPRCHLYFRKRDLTDASPPARPSPTSRSNPKSCSCARARTPARARAS